MRKLIKRRLIILCILLLSISIASISQTIEYRGQLDYLAIKFYQGEEPSLIIQELDNIEEMIMQEEEYNRYLNLSEMELFRGEMEEIMSAQKAEDYFDRAYKYAMKAIDIKESELSNRLAFESLTQLFNYRSFFFIIRNSSRASSLLEKLEDIENKELMTTYIIGDYYISAPEIGGGDKEQGIIILESILEKEHPVYNFLVYNRLYSVYIEKEKTEKAESYLNKAKDIYPDSPWNAKIF